MAKYISDILTRHRNGGVESTPADKGNNAVRREKALQIRRNRSGTNETRALARTRLLESRKSNG